MTRQRLPLTDIPVHGREFSFTDQSIWTEPLEQFGYDFEILKDFEGHLSILPQKKSFLIQGGFSGTAKLPCDRCAEPATVEMDESFQLFEEIPREGEPQGDESFLRKTDGETFELDIAGLFWEQFALALPSKVLCTLACRGICPACGKNRNIEQCECASEQGDPRLAALRHIKIK
ncbi:MAG: YceD family protein [Desulfovibrionales bacterium]